MKNCKTIILLFFTTALFLTNCAGSSTMIDGKQIVTISDRQVAEITRAVNVEDTEQRVSMLSEIELKTHVGDPVISNARGVAHLTNGDHQLAIKLFREAAESILQENYIFVNEKPLPDKLQLPNQRVTDHQYTIQDNSDLVNGLKGFIDHSDGDRLLHSVFEWAEFTPVPPTFSNSGVAGIALESFNELITPKPFIPYLITYLDPDLDAEKSKWLSLEKVARNLVTAGVLAADRTALEKGVEFLDKIPERSMSSTGRFIAGFGHYLLGNEEWDYFVHSRYRHMF